MPDSLNKESRAFFYHRKETIMNAIISNGNYTARVQLPVERRQLAGALSYLHANHASAYDIKYNEESDQGLTFTLECHGIVENAIAKALPTGFRFHALNDTIALMHNLPYTSKRWKKWMPFGMRQKRKACKNKPFIFYPPHCREGF